MSYGVIENKKKIDFRVYLRYDEWSKYEMKVNVDEFNPNFYRKAFRPDKS